MGPALALTGWVGGSLSAITVGFGAVLLGVGVDYGLHLYFALRAADQSAAKTVARLAGPLLGAGLTTVGAFAVQLFSSLPGQRQLALFAGVGVLLALLLALLVLPHFLGSGSPMPAPPVAAPVASGRVRDRRLLFAWVLGLGLLAGPAGRIDCVGDLREVNLVPADLRRAEAELREVWGDLRGRALAFARGLDLEAALTANERLYERLRREFSAAEIVSLAPVLPGLEAQRENRRRWRTFWSPERLAGLHRELARLGAEFGFAADAFQPFFTALTQAPPPLTREFWARAGFSDLLEVLLAEGPDQVTLLSLVPDRPGLPALIPEAGPASALYLVSPQAFSAEVSAVIAADLKRFIGLALLSVGLILLLLLRHLGQALLALLPVLAGLLTMFGGMGALGLSFNLFNLVAVILLIGLGVDYGIFMVYRLYHGRRASTERAVLVSGLTTLAGFGVLVLARHPALHSIGLTVLLGVGGALPTVLWVLPALQRRLAAARS